MNLPEIQNAIAHYEQQRADIPTFDLPALEAKVAYHSARQSIGTPEEQQFHRASLLMAINAHAQAEQQFVRLREIDAQLVDLKSRLQQARFENTQAIKRSAEQELTEALNEFKSLAKQVCRQWRRIQAINARNMGIKARTVAMPGFHFQHLSSGWNNGFATSDELAMGLLPFEQAEREQQTNEQATV